MKPTRSPIHWPETKGSDCYDWLSAETAITLALRAYYANCRSVDALPDDPAGLDATHNNGRACFAENVARDFEALIHAEGFRRGVPGFDDWGAAAFALAHGPRSPDRALPVSPCPRPTIGSGQHIHRVLLNR